MTLQFILLTQIKINKLFKSNCIKHLDAIFSTFSLSATIFDVCLLTFCFPYGTIILPNSNILMKIICFFTPSPFIFGSLENEYNLSRQLNFPASLILFIKCKKTLRKNIIWFPFKANMFLSSESMNIYM